MVQIECECDELHETEINSWDLFQEIKTYFEKKVQEGIYKDSLVEKPLQILDDDNQIVTQWFPTKWYKCNVCNTIWAFNYPDFPAKGSIYRLDPDGNIIDTSIFHIENRRRI